MLLLWDGNVKEGMHQLWKSVKLSSPFLHWSALYLEENSRKPNSSVLKVFVKNFSKEANEALNLQFKKFNLPSWPSVHWTPHLLFISDSKELWSTLSEKGDESPSSHNAERFQESNTDERSETLNGYFLDELLVIAQKYWIGKGGLKKIGWECSSVQSSIDRLQNSTPFHRDRSEPLSD